MIDANASALQGLKVLDLSGAMGNYCGKLFAELGADVVLVEPMSGNDLRRQPPFVDGVEGIDRSLSFFYYNTSKRGICVDLNVQAGQRLLAEMASDVDLIIEDAGPGRLAECNLDPADLIAVNPRLVVTSVSPFGQSGPYADYAHADIVCLALGGLLWLGGYADGPPVMAAGNQAFIAGNLFAAVASMVALTHAELQGEGQWVDVSVQESVTMAMENAAQFVDLEGVIRRRYGGTQRQAGFGVYPCQDGRVFLLAAGIGGNRFWPNFVNWMEEDGIPDTDRFRGEEWDDPSFASTDDAKELFWDTFIQFASNKSMQELYHQAQRWRVPLCPLNRPSDVLSSKQLAHRGFFSELQAFDRKVRLPGAPYRLSETPWHLSAPAPKLGEHTDVVLDEYGIDSDMCNALRQQGAIK